VLSDRVQRESYDAETWRETSWDDGDAGEDPAGESTEFVVEIDEEPADFEW
jgi:hypothetical protein